MLPSGFRTTSRRATSRTPPTAATAWVRDAMLLHVLHETAYDYVPGVRTARHMAHLKPATTPTQQLLSHRLTVDPAPARFTERIDVYGNTRSFFSLQFSHDSLKVS